MVQYTTTRGAGVAFRIRKRRPFFRFKKQSVLLIVSTLFFVAGSLCVWFAQVVAASVQTWTTPAVTQVDGGGSSNCAIAGSQLYCWGLNSNGQLGNNSAVDSPLPVAVNTSGVLSGKTILSVSVGYAHACVIASDNQVYCWGSNSSGQLGNNSTVDSWIPVAVNTSGVLSGKTILSVSVGYAHTCVIASDNQAYCWGDNGSGRLGNNSTTNSSVPVAVTKSGVFSGKTITAITTGAFFTCAIASDNLPYCWGYNTYGNLGNSSTTQSLVPVAVTATGVLSGKTVKKIATGTHHACVIASDNLPYCWGYNSGGQLGNNTTSTGATSAPVAVVTSGALSGKTVVSISADGWHVCAVASDGKAYCWGINTDGQLGNNSTSNSSTPVAVTTTGVLSGLTIYSMTTGYAMTCATASNSHAYCWGDNTNNQVGNNATSDQLVPAAVLFNYTQTTDYYRTYQDSSSVTPGTPLADVNTAAQLQTSGQSFRLRTGVSNSPTIVSMDTGDGFTCAVASDGKAYCWGRNPSGQLGNDTTDASLLPVPVDTSGVLSGKTIRSIATGSNHACVIASDGKVYCWGYGGDNGLGNGSTNSSSVPVAVTTTGVLAGKTVIAISVGAAHTCVIASDNLPYCWGNGTYGRLGNNGTAASSVPVAVYTSGVLSGKTVTAIAAGAFQTCVVASDTKAYCWGNNGNGQLGNNSTTQSKVPVAVTTSGVMSGSIRSVAAGNSHSCAVSTANVAYCWGNNGNGQLGNNSTTQSTVPVAVYTSGVLSGKSVADITTRIGSNHTCVITTNDSLYCWGLNSNGQLGNNSTTQSKVPVAVYTAEALWGKIATKIVASVAQTCVVVSDGGAYCWGLNTYGQLGDNSMTQRTAPTAVVTSSPLGRKKILKISSGYTHTCAIASDNQVYCWGFNTHGELGNNSTLDSAVPVAVDTSGVLSGKTIVAIAAGYLHTCALASDHQVYCWGENSWGALGNNSSVQSRVPVAVDTSGVLSGKTVLAISAGSEFSCAIASDNQAYCWGDNDVYGKLGYGVYNGNSLVPVAVDRSGVLAGKNLVAIASGAEHSCVIDTGGQAYCWGRGDSGQIGNNATVSALGPLAVDTTGVLAGKTVLAITPGDNFTCALASDYQIYCWGLNSNGQLGNNSTTQSLVPTAVDTSGALAGKTIASISAADSNACVLTSSNQIYCWGLNSNGQLGNNSTTQSLVPTAVDTSGVLFGKTITALSTRDAHGCALSSDGWVYCWGLNSNGQLGNNTTTDSSVPVALYSAPGIAGASMAAGSSVYKLQYAQLTDATCSAQTGFADVTASTPIAYATNASVSNGTSIVAQDTDPVSANYSSLQTFVSQAGTFTNTTAVAAGDTALWDFSLKDNALTHPNTSYCLRIVYGDGVAFNQALSYPQIITSPGVLSVGFVDSLGNNLTQPTFTLSSTIMKTTSGQVTTGSFADNSHRLRVTNSLSTTGWNVSIAASNGPTAYWNRSDSLARYDYNDVNTDANGPVDGSDPDSIAGFMLVNPATATMLPVGACSSNGVTIPGSSTYFSEGTTDAIALMSGSASSDFGCAWDLYGVGIEQVIPRGQPAGTYTIDMTATVVAL